MTKKKKYVYIAALCCAIVLVVLSLSFTQQNAFAEETSKAYAVSEELEYYWTMDGEYLGTTLNIKRGTTTGLLQFWYNGQLMDISTAELNVSEADKITYDNGYITVASNCPITYVQDDARLTEFLIYGGRDMSVVQALNSALRIRVIPNTKIYLYNSGAGPFTFSLTGADIQTIEEIPEYINVNANISNDVNESVDQIFTITNEGINLLQIKTSNLSNNYLGGNLVVEIPSITYNEGTNNITYSIENYPQLFENTSVTVYSYFHGGNGTVANPYQINSATQLFYIKNFEKYNPATSSYEIKVSFCLIKDITLDSNKLWTPVKGKFYGTFDGNYHEISVLNIMSNEGDTRCGFFENIESSGVVKNLSLNNVYIIGPTGSANAYVGAVAGTSNGNILNCNVTGYMRTDAQWSYMGGIVGANFGGTIMDCTSNCREILAENKCNIGGITGVNSLKGNINRCTSTSKITMYLSYTGNAGGIAGRNTTGAVIQNCVNSGIIMFSGDVPSTASAQPCMGQIVGLLQGEGTVKASTLSGKVDKGTLTGNQALYCSNAAIGKQE